MSEITLFCPEPPSLKLGPSPTPGEFIEFRDGWAAFDPKDFPDWEAWVKHPGTPYIEVILPGSGEVNPAEADAHVCPKCGKAFTTRIAMTGHLRSHKPKG
jgi:hypothetical protein